MSDDVMIRVQDLHKRFGSVRVLRGVTVEVRRGEVVVVIGPSGSGKSTFLRCLIGWRSQSMFDGGVIIEDGTPAKIFSKADHERTRRFLNQLHWEAA